MQNAFPCFSERKTVTRMTPEPPEDSVRKTRSPFETFHTNTNKAKRSPPRMLLAPLSFRGGVQRPIDLKTGKRRALTFPTIIGEHSDDLRPLDFLNRNSGSCGEHSAGANHQHNHRPRASVALTGGVAGIGLVGLFRASAYAPSQRHSHLIWRPAAPQALHLPSRVGRALVAPDVAPNRSCTMRLNSPGSNGSGRSSRRTLSTRLASSGAFFSCGGVFAF